MSHMPLIKAGAGAPEGAVTAPVGALYLRTDGGTDTTLYRKESGTGTTGWVAVSNPIAGSVVERMPNLVSPFNPLLFNGSAAPGANLAYGVRCTVPKTGTLTDISVYIQTSSGNIDVGVYDTDSSRTKLYSSGSLACPAGAAWRVIVASPGLSVTAGQQIDLAVAFDNGTAAIGRFADNGNVSNLPTGFWPGNGAAPLLSWSKGTSFPLPSTMSGPGVNTNVAAIIARVV
jgi:hypothetical protein